MAMTYSVFYMYSRHNIEHECISYDNATESYPTEVLLVYQQCQMECSHDSCSDSDDFQDTVPVADPRISYSKYGSFAITKCSSS